MPEEFDVAVIEGAVTTEESEATVRQAARARQVRHRLRRLRRHCRHPRHRGARTSSSARARCTRTCRWHAAPWWCRARSASVIDVDHDGALLPDRHYGFHRRAAARAVRFEQVRPHGYHVRAVQAQRHRLLLRSGPAVPGLGDALPDAARSCVNLGRACNGCRGLSPDANLAGRARRVRARGRGPGRFR